MCMWEGGDLPEIYRSSIRRAAKAHKCVECGRIIAVGETYRYDFQVYEGDAYSFRTCAHCQVAQAWLRRECGGYLIEGTWEDIAEHITEYPELRFPLGRLIVQSRKKWQGRDGGIVAIPPIPSATIESAVIRL